MRNGRATGGQSDRSRKRAKCALPPRCRDDITDRSDYEIRFIERNVMAAALGHDLLADPRQRDQARLILVVLFFALLTGRTRVLWKSSRQYDEWELAQHISCTS